MLFRSGGRRLNRSAGRWPALHPADAHQGEQARASASPSTIQPKDMTMSKTATDTATNELIRHAIAAWGYLVRWGSRLTLAEFAAAIRRHSSHARA